MLFSPLPRYMAISYAVCMLASQPRLALVAQIFKKPRSLFMLKEIYN